MINKENVRECIKAPMEQYHQNMKSTIGDWKVLVHVTEKILAGKKVGNEEFPPVFLPLIEMMRLILRVTKDSKWDWSDPAIQETYKNISESEIYKNFADATVGVVSSIVRKVEIGTLVEVGTGPGQVTTRLCKEMVKDNINVPIIISDKSPRISHTGENLRNAFPSLTIYDFVWDFGKDPPTEMLEKLSRPVLLFERFCVPYGGYGAIDKIGPVADVLIMVEYLSLTGRKEAYDIINEKIGTQFFTYSEAVEHLEKHFSFIYRCDKKTVEAVNAPVTIFTIATK